MGQSRARSRRCWVYAVALIGGQALGAGSADAQNDLARAEPWTAPPRLVIPVVDMDAAASFYRGQLGFRVVSASAGLVLLRSGPLTIALVPRTQTGLGGLPYVEYFVRPTVAVNATNENDSGARLSLRAAGKSKRLADPAGLVSVKRVHRARTLSVAIDRLGERPAERVPVGSITARETSFGVLFEPELSGLPPGLHSFHLHRNPSCDGEQTDGVWSPGAAAGGHYDPDNTGFHGNPYGYGHLGDLPDIYVNPKGKATMPVLAPRLAFEDLAGHSLMIHADGEHDPAEHAVMSGNPRMACGVVSSASPDARASVGSP